MSGPKEENERLRDALEQIEQWAAAYPETVFRPVSADQMHRASLALKAVGISMDAMHAEWARHIVSGIHEITRSALYPEAAVEGLGAGSTGVQER